MMNSTMKLNMRQVELINTFRQLWAEHVMWTRMFIISTAAELADVKLVEKRLLRNPADFAMLLERFYGKEKADKFEKLLTEHLQIAGQLVNAAKEGDQKTVEDAKKKWYDNADEIAAFLASINPYWSQREWQRLMHEHLDMTLAEATARLSGNYAEDIMMYDKIFAEAMKMADTMAYGIMKQFARQLT